MVCSGKTGQFEIIQLPFVFTEELAKIIQFGKN
jgi:hypothetical protein